MAGTACGAPENLGLDWPSQEELVYSLWIHFTGHHYFHPEFNGIQLEFTIAGRALKQWGSSQLLSGHV